MAAENVINDSQIHNFQTIILKNVYAYLKVTFAIL
jgi:hypothetical protein